MKRILFISMCLLAFAFAESKANPYRPERMFNYFYHSLNPYGDWIEIDYNLYAWKPSYVRYNWSPYRDGRWIWTDYGWYWDSYEPYGWAVYHYGRWIYDDYYGWLWMPDNEWGPAWVEWRYDNNYIGWSPLPPYASFRINVGIHFSVSWNSPHVHWTFVNVRHFHGVHVSRYIVRDDVKYRIFSKTKYRTNYSYESGRIVNYGVDRKLVERRSGARISQREINYTSETKTRDGGRSSNNTRSVSAYRPGETELTRYEGRTEITAKRAERKSNLQVDRIENNIYRERTSDRNSASGAARNNGSTGTATRERTEDRTGSAPERISDAERNTNEVRKDVEKAGREIRRSGTKQNESSGTRNSASEGNPTREKTNSGAIKPVTTPDRTNTAPRNSDNAPAARTPEVNKGSEQRNNDAGKSAAGRSGRERTSEPAVSTPVQRNSAPQEVNEKPSGSDNRGTTSGSGVRTQTPGRTGNNDNNSGRARSGRP